MALMVAACCYSFPPKEFQPNCQEIPTVSEESDMKIIPPTFRPYLPSAPPFRHKLWRSRVVVGVVVVVVLGWCVCVCVCVCACVCVCVCVRACACVRTCVHGWQVTTAHTTAATGPPSFSHPSSRKGQRLELLVSLVVIADVSLFLISHQQDRALRYSWLTYFKAVSRFGLAVRDRGTSVRIRFGSPFSSKVVVCGYFLVTLSLTINETLKWLSSLPTLMQKSFWWWQCSNRYIISLFPPPPYTLPPRP